MLSKPVWYVVAVAALLTPIGARAVIKKWERPTPVDPAMAQAGEALFNHEWKKNDPLANGGDGLGPVFNANSCVFCHAQARPGGGGDLEQNVLTYGIRFGPDFGQMREGVVHRFGGESLADLGPGLPAVASVRLDQLPRAAGQPLPPDALRLPRGVRVSQLNTPALFGAKLIDDLPDGAIIANEKAQRVRYAMSPAGGTNLPVGRATRTASGRVGKFGWKAQTASLGAFVRAACANELGLGNPGAAQPTPLNNQAYRAPALDLTDQQCDQLTAFVAALPRPVEKVPDDPRLAEQAAGGKKLFATVGCADCHVPDVGDVKGIYSDLLLHHMGADLEGGGSYYDKPLPPPPGPDPEPDPDGAATPAEWRTPPLWGVADSAPYMHDGRAATLEEAIRFHTGQGTASVNRFNRLTPAGQVQVVAFLKTLRAP